MIMGKRFIKRYLSEENLKSISDLIGEIERQTTGEIRVSLRQRRHFRERRLGLHELALKEFFQLGMDKTKERTGVLIFLLFSERRFHIVADEGIHKKVSDGTWDRLADMMSAHFRKGDFRQGILECVEQVGRILAENFPIQPGDVNELPNDVNVE
jgi:uncharacterized membrane protein